MRRVLLVGSVSALVALSFVAGAGGQAAPGAKPQALRNGCTKLFTQYAFRRYAKRVYLRERVTYKARRQMVRMVRCQHSPKAERKMRARRKGYADARRYRQAVDALTPYGGPGGTRWAVPYWPIVACESGGSWSAANPSGAVGPYQLLGKGAPFPVRTPGERLAHHRIAARLWAGGAGRSHWAQCL